MRTRFFNDEQQLKGLKNHGYNSKNLRSSRGTSMQDGTTERVDQAAKHPPIILPEAQIIPESPPKILTEAE